MTNSEITLRRAEIEDVAAIEALVKAAYQHYVERIGFSPRPMTDNYAEIVHNSPVTVAESNGIVAGVIVLKTSDEGFGIDNVAVAPSYHGKGIGKLLLAFAEREAKQAGFDSILLYTHEMMTENLVLYSRIGYEEYDRRSQGDFSLVFMRKLLQ